MNIRDGKAFSKPTDLPETVGFPFIIAIGLPLLALLALLFLGFGLTLQSDRADLTKTYSERTAEFLARDLADQMGNLITPAAQYVDDLAAKIRQTGCSEAECVFSVIQMQRAVPSSIPPQVAYIRFGTTRGSVSSIFRVDENDQRFLGNARTAEPDNTHLVFSVPGAQPKFLPYDLLSKGWYQAGMIRALSIWSAPFKNNMTNRCLKGESSAWIITRVVRIDGPDGKPLGVLAADVCINQIASLLQGMTGKTLEKISILTPSGEEMTVQNNELSITPHSELSAWADKLVYKEVPLTVDNLKGWRLAVILGPELSQRTVWNWKYKLGLLAALLCSIAFAAATAFYVVRPVRRLSQAVAEVGNLKLEEPIRVRTSIREIAFLAAIIEKMRIVLHGNQKRLEFLAYHDPASGFLNQAGMNRAYAEITDGPGQIELIIIKIRNYHHISSIMGEAALARLVARNIAILRAEFAGSTVGCLNDHQIACLYRSEEGIDVQRLNALLEGIRKPHEDDGVRISADISAAVAARQSPSDRFDTLLRRANGALHHAEENNSEDAVWYNPAIIQDLREALELGGDIAHAIARGEFFVRFQPTVELKTGKINAAHATVGWNHPELGVIRGRKFIPIFEKNGSIRHLGLYILAQSFEFLHHFKLREPDQKLQIGVKLSFVQLLDPLFIERVTELQKEWGIQAGEVKFIVTESAAQLQVPEIFRTMRSLRKLGFHLAIDQFAMAHAAVSMATAVQYDSMMIGTYVYQGIEQPGVQRIILTAACGLAAKLGMENLVTGVDNHAIIAPLVDCGCIYGMGPWFGLPATRQEFFAIYAENAALCAGLQDDRLEAGSR